MDQYEFIRTAHRVYGDTITEVAKETGHASNTVKKALKGEPWRYKEREGPSGIVRKLAWRTGPFWFLGGVCSQDVV